MNPRKLLDKLLSGSRNIRFEEATRAAECFGFQLVRVNGSHHIFQHPEITELVNLQNVNGQAKPYQVRQLLRLVEKYDLQMRDTE